MGEKNTLYYPTTGAGIGAQRAYLKIGGDGAQAQANARHIKAFSIDSGDEEATGIVNVEGDSSLFILHFQVGTPSTVAASRTSLPRAEYILTMVGR